MPKRERARKIIAELYPGGVPSQDEVPNVSICQQVGEALKRNEFPHISDDTILRAAGRRK